MSQPIRSADPAPPFSCFERFIWLVEAVELGDESYREIISRWRKTKDTDVSAGTISNCLRRLENYWRLKKGDLIQRKEQPLSLTQHTRRYYEEARNVIRAIVPSTIPAFSHQRVLTICTENTIERVVIPRVLAKFFAGKAVDGDQRPRIRVTECHSLFDGLEKLRTYACDVLLCFVHPEKHGREWRLPSFARFAKTDFKFELRDVAVIPRNSEFESVNDENSSIEWDALQQFPLAILAGPGIRRSIIEDSTDQPRVVVSSITASIGCALTGKFIGLAHDWPAEFDGKIPRQVVIRPLESKRDPLKIACYIREGEDLDSLIDAFKDFFAEEDIRRKAYFTLTGFE